MRRVAAGADLDNQGLTGLQSEALEVYRLPAVLSVSREGHSARCSSKLRNRLSNVLEMSRGRALALGWRLRHRLMKR